MKKDKKMLTIGEVSKLLRITRRMIINYEDKGLISPDLKEGPTGNRYYTIDTLSRIRTIRVFQNMGLTLDEIRVYYDGSTDLTPMLLRLESLRDELNLNIEKVRERVNDSSEPQINILTIPQQTVFRQERCANASLAEKTSALRDVSILGVRRYGFDITKRMFFTEIDMNNPDVIYYCFAIPSKSEGEFVIKYPETQALCIYYHGGYENLPSIKETILNYAKENNIELAGTCRHIYLEGPPQHKDPNKFITQVALPIKKK